MTLKKFQTGFNIFIGPMFLTHGCLFYHASFESTFRINFSMSTPAKVALEKNLSVLSVSSNDRMLPLLIEVQYFMNNELNNSFFFVKSDGKPCSIEQSKNNYRFLLSKNFFRTDQYEGHVRIIKFIRYSDIISIESFIESGT